MKQLIKEYINNPGKLEKLYHDDKAAFKSGFEEVSSEIAETDLYRYWKARLDYSKTPDKIKSINLPDIIILISSCLIAALLIREVELTVAKYLPVYVIWILFVVFAFPLILSPLRQFA